MFTDQVGFDLFVHPGSTSELKRAGHGNLTGTDMLPTATRHMIVFRRSEGRDGVKRGTISLCPDHSIY